WDDPSEKGRPEQLHPTGGKWAGVQADLRERREFQPRDRRGYPLLVRDCGRSPRSHAHARALGDRPDWAERLPRRLRLPRPPAARARRLNPARRRPLPDRKTPPGVACSCCYTPQGPCTRPKYRRGTKESSPALRAFTHALVASGGGAPPRNEAVRNAA